MKPITILLLVALCFCRCSQKAKTINFITLHKTEFNAKRFELPGGEMPDSLQRAHDSCMGFAFAMNAVFIQTKDTFAIGSLLNRQSLKVVNTIGDVGLTRQQMAANFTVVTNPCYENRVLHFPLLTLLGNTFSLQVPGANDVLNKEINEAVFASDDAEMQTGSWVYLDMKGVLKNILDTAKSEAGLRYKKNLLDTANMVVAAIESVTEINFMIHAKKELSPALQALLQTKPSSVNPQMQTSLRLSYINNTQFEITLNGFFPVIGQFMKAELK